MPRLDPAATPTIPGLERGILELWEREGHIREVRERNRGGPRSRSWTGRSPPTTRWASTTAGPHAQGRLPALQGDARARDALPERLRLPGPARRGRGREVARAGIQNARSRPTAWPSSPRSAGSGSRTTPAGSTEQSRRLGMWMDWGNDYFTFSDTNIEYIWRFLKEVHRARLAVQGPPLDPVVSSLRHVALEARAGRGGGLRKSSSIRRSRCASRCTGATGESLVVWTTTPWTLPANVAAAVKPDAEYGLPRRQWVAVGPLSRRALRREGQGRGARRASLHRARSTTFPAQEGVEHRVIPWDEVSLDEGTGIVHIAPGCGAEDFELSREVRLGGADADRRVGPDAPRLRRLGGTGPPKRCSGSGDRVAARAGAAGLGRVRSSTVIPSAGAARRRSSSG